MWIAFSKANLLLSPSQFSPDQPVTSETAGYVRTPSLKEKIHCVAFVVDASKIATYPKGLSTTFKKLREHISDLGEQTTEIFMQRVKQILLKALWFGLLGVHQVALLTHVDQICPETDKDISQVYQSRNIQDTVGWNRHNIR